VTNPSHQSMLICKACGGTGTIWVEHEIFHRQSFNRDTGDIEVRTEPETCGTCEGNGERMGSDKNGGDI